MELERGRKINVDMNVRIRAESRKTQSDLQKTSQNALIFFLRGSMSALSFHPEATGRCKKAKGVD
jgi:hypothetical protein